MYFKIYSHSPAGRRFGGAFPSVLRPQLSEVLDPGRESAKKKDRYSQDRLVPVY